MLRASRHTLVANIVQQFCAGALLLFLPNFLNKADYAEVVFISVLLSFIGFADAGMSQAYGRVVPALLTQEKHEEVQIWGDTTLRFGLLSSCVYSVVITLIYYQRYGDIIHALLLLPMPFIVVWFSFYIGRFSSTGNFRKYRIINTWRSAASLLAIPLVLVSGLTGFFISNLMATIIALASVGKPLLQPIGKPDWQLVREHLPEGLILSLSSVLGMTLMNFSRFYASINYKAEDIATYGIIGAAGMSLLALVISIFLPVGVELRSRYGKSEAHALGFIGDVVKRSFSWLIGSIMFVVILTPFVFHICFPAYHFDRPVLNAVLLGIAIFVFQTMYVHLMVMRKKFTLQLIFVAIGIAIGWLSALVIDYYYPAHGAAYGQLIGITSYTLMLFANVSNFSDITQTFIWRKQAEKLFLLYGLCALIMVVL